ncbi:hypothetical protein [Xanthomonas theicola]|uniref:hypothetical protein n=1 Tax=Xanthomonas theicola TaxID=56464 RepID=UPI000FF8B47E|nr:hypothetical protein [Xanthomonas theicola]QNH24915.1 hypothetical protein G4Q83_09375 [Xanthomonas theicola]
MSSNATGRHRHADLQVPVLRADAGQRAGADYPALKLVIRGDNPDEAQVRRGVLSDLLTTQPSRLGELGRAI